MTQQNPDTKALFLADITHYETLRHILPQAVRALANGDTISFGPYAVSPDGIHCQNKHLAWDDVHAATLQHDVIFIQARDEVRPWHCSPVSQIPNAAVFLALVNPLFARRKRRTEMY